MIPWLFHKRKKTPPRMLSALTGYGLVIILFQNSEIYS